MSSCTICHNKTGGFSRREPASEASIRRCYEEGHLINLPVCEKCVQKLLDDEPLTLTTVLTENTRQEKRSRQAYLIEIMLADNRSNPGKSLQYLGYVCMITGMLLSIIYWNSYSSSNVSHVSPGSVAYLQKELASQNNLIRQFGGYIFLLAGLVLVDIGICFRRIVDQHSDLLKLLLNREIRKQARNASSTPQQTGATNQAGPGQPPAPPHRRSGYEVRRIRKFSGGGTKKLSLKR